MSNNIDTESLDYFRLSLEQAIEKRLTVTIYDKKDRFISQGKIVYINNSYFIIENKLNLKESFLFADLATGEQKTDLVM